VNLIKHDIKTNILISHTKYYMRSINLKNIKVSIITVTYNSEKYLSSTIESVLNQTYNNIEYIIIDGMSSDNTISIINRYEHLFNGRLKWLSEADSGIYEAMNKGISMATGEIIGIVNSDDWYEKDTVISIVETIGEHDMIHANMNLIDIHNNVDRIYSHRNTRFFKYLTTPYNHPTMFVKKEVYQKIGVFDEKFKTGADYDFMLRFNKSKYNAIHFDRIITNVRLVGVTTGANSVKDFSEFKQALVNNGVSNAKAAVYVYLRKVLVFISKILRRHPKVLKIIRVFIPYQKKRTRNK